MTVEFVRCSLIAVRQHGEPGWDLRTEEGLPDAVLRRVRQTNGAGCNVQLIREYQLNRLFIGAWWHSTALQRGWVFDSSINGWRAPDEPLLSLPAPPQRLETLDVSLDLIAYGQIRFDLTAGDQRIALTANSLVNEFIDLVQWITLISHGSAARCAFVVGEHGRILHGIPVGNSNCRVVVTNIAGDELWDAVFTTTVVVAAFAAFLSGLAEHPCLGLHWCCHGGLTDEQDEIYNRESNRIEAELDARFSKDDWSDETRDERDQLEAEMMAAAVPLTEEQQQYVHKYRNMLKSLTVPDGWASTLL